MRATETDGWPLLDFATIFLENLETKQDSTEVIKALTEIVILLKERNEEIEDTPIALKDSVPKPNDGKMELESVSDSSDWNHIGNGSPCPNYNHDGCSRGVNCELSHGPDYKSVRDRLYVFSSGLSPSRRKLTLDAGQRAQRLCEIFTR